MTFVPAKAAVTTGYGPTYIPPAQAPYGQPPAYAQPPQPTQAPLPPPTPPKSSGDGGAKRRRVLQVTALVAIVLAAGLLGGIVGGAIAHRTTAATTPTTQSPVTTTYPAETVQTQSIQLCTAYATINSAMPKPQSNALEVLPAVNGLRIALNDNPAASPEIRSAITDVVHNYDALIAAFGKVRDRGLAKPPTYDLGQAQEILDRAWNVCKLG